ncbi:OmpA family protein [Helicobacter sp. MIT 14-3879]|uniref:OmpA family protein n=1 Tax=Helicobacter sp. MIT 14-3879 TaxID=2040649 RepID=UPI000E1EEF96|nr:OmpA family protein [Helicobacter sp. MIT 14-3879]RDU64825.1 hypothetical protein CQA44_03700 [Helicobacter sp. MIT 14-3879]
MKNSFEWISISDMFAGIMMVFLLVAITFMFVSQKQSKELIRKNKELSTLNNHMSEILKAYSNLQLKINRDLVREFSSDLSKWNATINDTNTIRFNELDAIFEIGKADIREDFKVILDDFFPRYMAIINKYRNDIEEIVIEGHASNIWRGANSLDDSFLFNAVLSQNRALNVMRYCFLNNTTKDERDWLMRILHSNGMSFSQPLESEEKSRRVEFRVITKAFNNIKNIIDSDILRN